MALNTTASVPIMPTSFAASGNDGTKLIARNEGGNFVNIEQGDIVKFIDPDPEFVQEFGMVGTVTCTYPPTNQPGCELPLVQVDYHGSYGVHRPDQLERLL